MNSNFLKFKKRATDIRILKSVLAALSAGLLIGGVFLLLSRLAVIEPEPIIALPVALAVAALGFLIAFFALRKSDLALAKRLDSDFALSERVQTMIESADGDSPMLRMQREDAEKSLGRVNLKSFKAKHLWIYIVAASLGLAVMLTAFFVPDLRSGNGEADPPFHLTAMQRAGLSELITYVENSEMAEQYKLQISAELTDLLSDLETVDRMSLMRARLTEAMAYILDVTSDSSTTSEILDAIWKSGDADLQYLAFALNPNDWSPKKDDWWGEYSEKINDYIKSVVDRAEKENPDEHHTIESLTWMLESSGRKIPIALGSSGIATDDALREAIQALATSTDKDAKGYEALKDQIVALSYEEAKEKVVQSIDTHSTIIFDALATNKKNSNTGEYTITKLSTLFLVPAPEFERPDFVKYGQTVGDDGNSSDKEDGEGGSEGGGVGDGSVFGSNDLVLDPLTGEYVEYGTLLDKYYAVVFEKLQNGSYSDEQKKMIENYFALLYGGIKKEEGK